MNVYEDLKWRGLIKDVTSPELEEKLNMTIQGLEWFENDL